MSTTPEQNKAVIKRFLEAWNNREPDAFDQLADIFDVWSQPGASWPQ